MTDEKRFGSGDSEIIELEIEKVGDIELTDATDVTAESEAVNAGATGDAKAAEKAAKKAQREAEKAAKKTQKAQAEAKTKAQAEAKTKAQAEAKAKAQAEAKAKAQASSGDKRGGTTGKRLVRAFVGIVVLGLLCGYAYGVHYYSGHFLPNTQLDGADLSDLSIDEAAQALDAQEALFSVSVQGEGLDITITPEAIGRTVDSAGIVASAHELTVNEWRWPLDRWGAHDLDQYLVASYDPQMLEQFLSAEVQAVNAQAKAPRDAYVIYSPSAQRFEVVNESYGNTIDPARVVAKVEEALDNEQDHVEIGSDDLLVPKHISDDEAIQAACDKANGYLSGKLVIAIDGKDMYTVDAKDIANFVVIDDDLQVSLDTAALRAWAQKMESALNSVGKERVYTRADGKVVTVSGGTYGWRTRSTGLADRIVNVAENGKQERVNIASTQKAYTFTGVDGKDWGRYLDVDLSEQMARYYDASGNLLWESGIVSGKPATATPTGVYTLSDKQSPATLQSYNGTITVNYWMPFAGNVVGLNDSSTQSSFGGTAYKDGAGTRGNVDLPPEKARELYELISVGEAVVVHW